MSEALRAARIAEAWRRSDGSVADTLDHLADLYETNWTPPVVDPDLLAAREWMSANFNSAAIKKGAVDGDYDNAADIRAYLAGCTRGREGAKGLVEALEWYAYRYNYLAAAPDGHDYVKRARAALASAKRGG